MSDSFVRVVNMGISAGWLVLAVLALRLLLKKAPKWIRVFLWGLVGIRLLCPFSIESVFSLLPSRETIDTTRYVSRPYIQSGLDAVDQPINEYLGDRYFEGVTVPTGHTADLATVLAMIWILGMAAMVLYGVVGYLRLRKKVQTAVCFKDNILQSEQVISPFVLGVFRPKIYLPFRIDEGCLDLVIAHEQAHIQRGDHYWKPLGFLLLCVYWFHPLMWVAYLFLCRDIELACDEKVIQKLEVSKRADYSEALLSSCVHRRVISACPLAFGEISVKERVRSVLSYKKPAVWIVAAAVVVSGIAGVCFLTDPIEKTGVWLTGYRQDDNGGVAQYEWNGKEALSGFLVAEQWKDGQCVQSTPVSVTDAVGQVALSFQMREVDNGPTGVEIQLDTGENGGSVLTYFAFPEGETLSGWSFVSYPEKETIPAFSRGNGVLAAICFDFGGGVRPLDCEALTEDPTGLLSLPYTLVIRGVFDGGELPLPDDAVAEEGEKEEETAMEPIGEETVEEITKLGVNFYITEVLRTLTVYEDQTVSFSLPEGEIPFAGDSGTKLTITLNATFSPEAGTFATQSLLDWETDWEAGETYQGTLDPTLGTLQSVMLRVAFMTEIEEDAFIEYAADYLELDTPFSYGVPAGYSAPSVEIQREEETTDFTYTLKSGELVGFSIKPPDEWLFQVSREREGNELPVCLIEKGGVTIGTLRLLPFGTTDVRPLRRIETEKDALPMEIFSTAALSNHAGYEDYHVSSYWDTGATATGKYIWQDLSSSAGNAADIPWQEMDCILAYDWEGMPYYVEVLLQDGVLTKEELSGLAVSVDLP